MSFPLIVHGALMIEPTETESKADLDEFILAMKTIAREAAETPDIVKSAPHDSYVGRLDETGAARNPVLRWEGGEVSRHVPPEPHHGPAAVLGRPGLLSGPDL